MRIELAWPRADGAERTVAVTVPGISVTGLAGPASRQVRRLTGLCGPGVLRGVIACAEPVICGAAGAVGAGAFVQLSLAYALRIARQSRREEAQGARQESFTRDRLRD